MRVTKYEDKEAWLEGRNARITGTRKVIPKRKTTKPLQGYYELIAEQLATPDDGENEMDRGNRLEDEAVVEFTKETGIEIITDLVIWERDDNHRISLSPDGYTEDLKTAVEVKCKSSANHVKALIEKQVPSEHLDQVIQYFVVNEDLEKLYFVMYDPRMSVHSLHILEVTRDEITDKVETYLASQRNTLESVDMEVNRLLNS